MDVHQLATVIKLYTPYNSPPGYKHNNFFFKVLDFLGRWHVLKIINVSVDSASPDIGQLSKVDSIKHSKAMEVVERHCLLPLSVIGVANILIYIVTNQLEITPAFFRQ